MINDLQNLILNMDPDTANALKTQRGWTNLFSGNHELNRQFENCLSQSLITAIKEKIKLSTYVGNCQILKPIPKQREMIDRTFSLVYYFCNILFFPVNNKLTFCFYCLRKRNISLSKIQKYVNKSIFIGKVKNK